ncbi:MAG: ABC transporter ATP-binding protein [Fusicatenibacter sp.]
MITVEHLTKCYGDFMAVNDLSFEIDEGHVYGFLGPNGAGKSTTMNIMTGCLSATEGHIRINGYDIFEQPEQAKKLIGYLPEQPPLYMNETPMEYLQFVGEAKGLKGKELRRQIEEVVDQVKITQVRNRLISTLSKGYRQRVGIAQALLGNPKVIILDEPTVGLDPIQIIEIRDLIKQLGENHTVILSSHILSEVQAICEKVLIISKGKLVAFDAPENLEKLLLSANSNCISIETEATEEEAGEILDCIEQIDEWEAKTQEENVQQIEIRTTSGDTKEICRQLFFAFAEKQKAILQMSWKRANLEDVFIELTEGEKEAVTDEEQDPDLGQENSESEVDEE